MALSPSQKAQLTRKRNNPDWGKTKPKKHFSSYHDPNNIHDVIAMYAAEQKITIHDLYEQSIVEFLLRKKDKGIKSRVFTEYKDEFDTFIKFQKGSTSD